MSRIYDALKKAEQQAQGAPASAPDVAAAAPTGAVDAPSTAGGAWGVVPAEQLKELATVRRTLESSFPERGRFAVGVVTSVPGEGSTTVLLGFARTLVADPRLRVLLVDADAELRQLSRDWGAFGSSGWSDLRSPGDVAAAITHTPVTNLDLLPYGGQAGLSAALGAELLTEAVRTVATQYHYVLFDCGSMLGTPLSRYVTGAMDGVLLVVHASRTRREICQKAVEELHKSQANVLGVILNRRRYLIPEAIYKRI